MQPGRPTESQLADFLRALPLGAFIKEANGNYTYLNPATQRYFATTAEHGLGKTLMDLVPPETAVALIAADREILATLQPKMTEVAFPVAGVQTSFEVHKFPIAAPGQPTRIGGIAVDVTRAKSLDSALRLSEERYRSVVAAMAEGVVLQAADGKIIAHNKQAETILGLTHDQLIGQTSVDFTRVTLRRDGSLYPGEEHPAMVTLRTGRSCRGEVMGIRSDAGATRWININTEPLTVAHAATPYAVVATFADITDLVEREEALAGSEQRMSRMLEIGEFGVSEIDLVGRTALCSPKHRAIFGYDQPDPHWSYEKFLSHIVPEDRPRVEELARGAIAGGQSLDFECRIRRADGVIRWLRVWGEILLGPGGQPRLLRGLVLDITLRKEAEDLKLQHERAEQQAKKLESLGILCSGIAHDFNNILGGVGLAAELLGRDATSEESAHKLALIRAGIKRAADLTSQMLTFAGNQRFSSRPVRLPDFLRALEPELRVAAGARTALGLVLEPDLPAIEADPNQLRLLVLNLVQNAIEAAGDGPGSVTIRVGPPQTLAPESDVATSLPASPAGNYLCLEITDTGAGMTPETREHMYEPFFSTKFAGRGLGLAAVLGVVRAHKGAISSTSNPGHETCFRVYFPLAAKPDSQPPMPEQAPAPKPGRGTVLVVEDDEDLRSTLTFLLELEGFAVVAATDGKPALDQFRANPGRFDLVVMDLVMPRMDGDVALQEMQRLRTDIPVIMISGYAPAEVMERLQHLHPAACLRKPFEFGELRKAIQQIRDRQGREGL